MRSVRILVAVTALVTPPLVASSAAVAAPGPGTFTKITTPVNGFIYQEDVATNTTLHIAGQTSADVTSLDLVCIYQALGATQVQDVDSGIPVVNNAFDVEESIEAPINCRLRAVPSGVDPATSYLGSYAGPIIYANTLHRIIGTGAITTGYLAVGEQGSGYAFLRDAGTCGAGTLATITTPQMDMLGPGNNMCAFVLPSGNITATGTPDASAIRVDGHNAYLPAAVSQFLHTERGLTVTQSHLTVTFSRTSTGDLTIKESAPLVRCSGDDTYPPTSVSCPDVIGTGVTFTRTVNVFRGAHQIRMRDSFTSTDSVAHTVAAQYAATFLAPQTGAVGYVFPGGTSSFSKATPDEVVLGLGTKAANTLVRSDLNSVEGDPQADTVALTWSRAPSKLQFDHLGTPTFAMPYSLKVPAAGKAFLGFAASEGNTTAAAKSVASAALKEMVHAPTITSPKAGATIKGHRTTVKGTVTLGANGMPTTVTVNGHRAKLTKLSATRDSYVVSFTESFGKHKLTVTAKDVAGNTASATRRVTNKS